MPRYDPRPKIEKIIVWNDRQLTDGTASFDICFEKARAHLCHSRAKNWPLCVKIRNDPMRFCKSVYRLVILCGYSDALYNDCQ